MNDTTRKSSRHYAIGKKNPNLPFHPAVRAGDFIFVSGQVPKDENNNMVSGTIEEETLATLKTIARVERDSDDKPRAAVVLQKVTIVPEGQPMPPLPATPQPAMHTQNQ